MANLFQPSLNRATDSDGKPVSGAQMWFFLTGTTTPATWYMDSAGTIPGTNPLVADASGKFTTPAYLTTDTIYRIRLTESDGTTLLWPDVDPVKGYDEGMISTAAANALVSQLQADADAASTAADRVAVALDRALAESARSDAISAAIGNNYYPGARSYVPQGLKSVSIAAAGTGGTNGTYVVPLSGSNLSVAAYVNVTVSGGAITAVSVNAPGLYIGSSITIGTVNLSSITGLTGATVTPAGGYLKASGEYYLTDHATDVNQVALFQNQANAAVQINASIPWMNAALAAHYANDNTDVDVPGGSSGDRGAKFWATQASASAASIHTLTDIEYERSGYTDFVVDADYRMEWGIDTAGAVYTEAVRVATALPDFKTSAGFLVDLEYSRSGYTDFVVDADFRALSAVGSAGEVYIENVRVSTGGISTFAALSDTPANFTGSALKGVRVNAAGTALEFYSISAAAGTGRIPEIFIAASNAPQYQKDMADYVCTGTNDDAVIQGVLNGFPVIPDFIRSKHIVSGARCGSIVLSFGTFFLSNYINVPAGSVTSIKGMGKTSWREGDPVNSTWDGGTMLYSTDSTGRIIDVPQHTGVRSDTGATETVPMTSFWLSDIQLRVFNPASTQTYDMLGLNGWQAGTVTRVHVAADLNTNTTPRISGCISVSTGARVDRKRMVDVTVTGARNYGFNFNTTHLYCDTLVAHGISGGTSPACFSMQPNFNNTFFNMHAFSCNIGIKSTGGAPLHIGSIMFESIATPVQINNIKRPVIFGVVDLNSDVSWTGDIATDCVVQVLRDTDVVQTLRARNGGTATIAAGQTSVNLTHYMPAAPAFASASPNDINGVGYWVTKDATNVTIHIPSALGADASFDWLAFLTKPIS